MIKLSQAGKMPCKSFSLQAGKTCPGMFEDQPTGPQNSFDFHKNIKPICQGCYALKGFYHMPGVKKVQADNYDETLKDLFTTNMVRLIKKENKRFFRWFDSGDIYSNAFLLKVISVCEATPEVKHWIPTKSRELFSQPRWEFLEGLKNVTVRFSSPATDGEFKVRHGSTVSMKYNHKHKNDKNLFQCPAGQQDGKCKSCRACWSKKIKVINYIFH